MEESFTSHHHDEESNQDVMNILQDLFPEYQQAYWSEREFNPQPPQNHSLHRAHSNNGVHVVVSSVHNTLQEYSLDLSLMSHGSCQHNEDHLCDFLVRALPQGIEDISVIVDKHGGHKVFDKDP